MGNIRNYVYDNQIFSKSNRDYYHHYTFEGESGVIGNSGPKLQDAFYNASYEHAYYSTPKRISYKTHWDKPYEEYQDVYPIIVATICTDGREYSDGNLSADVGENVIWDNDWYCGADNSGMDLRGYGEYFDITETDGYFNQNSYNTYYCKNPINASLIMQGYDAILRDNETISHWMGSFGVAKLPANIGGPSRQGNVTIWSATYDYNNAAFTESTPRQIYIDTNIPFLVYDKDYYDAHLGDINWKCHSYLTDGDLTRFHTEIADGHAVFANNYVAPSVTEGTTSYDMYCDVYRGEWDIDSVENEHFVKSRYLQAWVKPNGAYPTPRVSMYREGLAIREEVDGTTYIALRAKLKVYGDLVQVKWSTDGGNSWTTEEADPRTTIDLPWDTLYFKRTNQRGKLLYDKNHGGNMLLYSTEALCDEGSPYMAEDYNEKNFYYPTTNSTGDPELSTLMGQTGMKSAFSTKYVLTYSDLVNLSNELFDSHGMIDDLKKGREMLGSNPIDAIQGLMYFPFDLANFFNLGTSQSIIIGGYTLQTANGKFMTSYNGFFEIGSISIVPSFPGEDYRNYEPYCNLNVFLPFIGLQSLKMNKYVGKIMSIRYYLDATNGACMACLFADGLLTDYFTGQVGVNLPITLTDYASYAGAAMQSIVAMAEGGSNSLLSVPQGDVSGAIEGLTEYETSLFNLSQNSINNFKTTKGTSSSLMNHFLPNYVYVIFEIIETDETSNLATLQGRRSNASGSINSFSGFLQTEWVNLSCGIATEEEKDEIQKYLASGIYI